MWWLKSKLLLELKDKFFILISQTTSILISIHSSIIPLNAFSVNTLLIHRLRSCFPSNLTLLSQKPSPISSSPPTQITRFSCLKNFLTFRRPRTCTFSPIAQEQKMAWHYFAWVGAGNPLLVPTLYNRDGIAEAVPRSTFTSGG